MSNTLFIKELSKLFFRVINKGTSAAV